MLIDRFGEDICFTYPKDRKKPQMFFSSQVSSEDVVETLRANEITKLCAEALRKECEDFNYNLEESYKTANDLRIAQENFDKQRPPTWEKFFNAMFPYRKSSPNITKKCDLIFQVVYNLVHNGRKRTPFHVAIAETIHDICKSKKLIQIMNRLGLCSSYDEMERIDIGLATKIINEAGENRVPVGPSIQPNSVIHGAMDNFDHDENTASGIGGSHDTILMLFQNQQDTPNVPSDSTMTVLPNSTEEKATPRSLEHIVPCQVLLKSGRFGKRGEIPSDFKTSTDFADAQISSISHRRYLIWSLARSKKFVNSTGYQEVPSFVSACSLLSPKVKSLTNFAFTPILPHPATEYDTIYTCMVNFKDVLKQKHLPYGSLWCDEGVYKIAKEFQLLNEKEFDNIFWD